MFVVVSLPSFIGEAWSRMSAAKSGIGLALDALSAVYVCRRSKLHCYLLSHVWDWLLPLLWFRAVNCES